ncbi:MAG: CBS domain-containing protein [Acidobacteria bacterium]|nr:CBS domain-containing protein [Acidobacteriota bacterium]
MRVRDVMLAAPITTTPEETLESLLPRQLASRQATAAVLGPGDELVGVVGIHDILRKIIPLYVDLDEKLMEVMHEDYVEERLQRLKNTRVADLMTRRLDTVSPDDYVTKAAAIIVEHCRKTLPVIQDGKFIGMITRRSILEKIGPTLL